ncbi:MAG: hypothetical protein ABF624_00015 [Liquorilactobacillus ghanensis]|uniref:hypothetical protein n=1 Tax=Liquorilactobacillus ghanensis TaxID=399370 RepID=UPI0039EB0BFD
MTDKYELLRKLEADNPKWYEEISEDDKRLIKLRKAWNPPHNRGKQHTKITWDDDKIMRLTKLGLTGIEISKVLGIKSSTLYSHLSHKGKTFKEMRNQNAV